MKQGQMDIYNWTLTVISLLFGFKRVINYVGVKPAGIFETHTEVGE